MHVSITNTVLLVLILIATFFVAFMTNKLFQNIIKKGSGEIRNKPTNYRFLRHFITGLIYVIGISIAIYSYPPLRTLASSLLAGAGILAVAVGFASQHALGNLISGVFIVIFKPFRVGDRLQIRELIGIVEDITLRHTVIRDFENKRILIPNALISSEVIINADIIEEVSCKWIDVRISFDSDIELAKNILEQTVLDHPLLIDNRTEEQIENGNPIVQVRVISMGDYSILLRAWAWSKNSADGFIMSCDVIEKIISEYKNKGIEIPTIKPTPQLKTH